MAARKTAKKDHADASTIGESALGEVAALARLLVNADAEVERIENLLKDANAHARRIREEALPGAMQELDLKEVTLSDGSKIKVADEVYCSITEAKKVAAFEWLEDNDFGGLIKTGVEIAYGRDEREAAVTFYNQLLEEGKDVSISAGVHAQTLKAWMKEQLAAGRNVPMDLFGARSVTVAKVTLPKTIKRV